jgi:hypothetical protein
VITRIEALHYRALRYVSQGIGAFQVLVGPNACAIGFGSGSRLA